MISNAIVASALLDRLTHNTHHIELRSEFMRKLTQTG
ncbi:ATP-binding protein [Vibrio sagamiensis]|nr:ATP-binding protein [Vibrio sagamiensis]